MKSLPLLFAASSLFLASIAHAQQAPQVQPLPPLPSQAPSAPDAQPAVPAAPEPAPAAAPPAAPPPAVAYTPGASYTEASPAVADDDDEDRPGVDGAPRARTGFQLALRTGYMLPMGSATGAANDDLANSFGGELPLFVDIGGKPDPHFFLGAYLGVGVGGAGSQVTACSQSGVSCTTTSARIGVQAHYHILPAEKVDPWIGYGIGFEAVNFSGSGPGGDFSLSASGVEYGHFMGGIDFRVSRTFGVGPMVDFAVGQYSHETFTQNGTQKADGDITNTATHEWLQLGIRFVFFP